MTNFQIVVTGVFIFFIAVGVILFATFGSRGSTESVGPVKIWGSVDESVMREIMEELQDTNEKVFDQVSYKEVDAQNFNQDLAEAIAAGKGPDVFILPQDQIMRHQEKILPIPYESYSVRDFKNRFIEEGELYLSENGILAFPFIVDPMVMYWNRDIFSREGVSRPPTSWDQFFSLSQAITDRDDNFNIFTSLIALGDYRNITHAKEIISTLVMQTGNPISYRDNGSVEISLKDDFDQATAPAVEAINFYTQFSNPVKSVYTWNRALPESKRMFLAGDLALYLGFASELSELRSLNPNLNFDVAEIPQAENGNVVTFGKMNGLAIVKASRNSGGAFRTINALTEDGVLQLLTDYTNLPPVSRSLLSEDASDPYLDVFYKSALFSKGWLDPDKKETDEIFENMIDSVVSGRRKVSEAVARAHDEMRILNQ